jgi:hypothetical protein
VCTKYDIHVVVFFIILHHLFFLYKNMIVVLLLHPKINCMTIPPVVPVKSFRTIPLCGKFSNHISRTFLNHSSHVLSLRSGIYGNVTLYIINILAFKGFKQFFMTSFNLNRLSNLAHAMKKSEDLHDVI